MPTHRKDGGYDATITEMPMQSSIAAERLFLRTHVGLEVLKVYSNPSQEALIHQAKGINVRTITFMSVPSTLQYFQKVDEKISPTKMLIRRKAYESSIYIVDYDHDDERYESYQGSIFDFIDNGRSDPH
jgi:hypothetical protein